ncbi:hypothetical protein [Robbsia andropogonis]|uniref:hypothetical protein n=1 Tax=Robbsia andropogonis TaxID=28092 RepID=UPI00209D6FBC|nr:hypothetical protein [Robbsia andropogonis]MCP1117720.1 hypothetical protein [Robbsia andropogonis]MCP1127186.1 hypothetical protein [Robbsia andropogonis]
MSRIAVTIPRAILSIVLLALAALVCGCANSNPQYRIHWSGLTLSATSDANGDNPVAVDLVLSSDVAMTERIAAMSAAQWYAQREALQALFPDRLHYFSWEIVSGQTLHMPRSVMAPRRVNAALVFARYGTPGVHRARITARKGPVTIRLTRENIEIVGDR